MAGNPTLFPFRPWVRRAGLSIVLVAAGATALMGGMLVLRPEARFGWSGEPAVWLYVAALWIGGLKVWLGTWKPVAEVSAERLLLRPLHNIRRRSISWEQVRGTEQMIGGDRLIVYYDTPRGMRFAALNLNLVKGRRDFLAMLDRRLLAEGYVEKVVDRSRYLTKP